MKKAISVSALLCLFAAAAPVVKAEGTGATLQNLAQETSKSIMLQLPRAVGQPAYGGSNKAVKSEAVQLPAAFRMALQSKSADGQPVELTQTVFDTLAKVFDQSRKPSLEELRGFFAGRAFLSDAPDHQRSTALAGLSYIPEQPPVEVPPGGLFIKPQAAPAPVFRVEVMYTRGGDADYYDNPDQEGLKDIESFAKAGLPHVTLSFDERSAVAVYKRKGFHGLVHQIRKYGNYIIVKTTDSTDGKFSSYSYYFKDITPKK